MKHFHVCQWADFARGIARDKDRAEMEAHLATGCWKCRRTADILREVAELASAETDCHVPPYAIHNARAFFALQRPERVYVFPRTLARLVHDSFKEPLPAGLRARHRLTRHALYETADYSVDLRLEHQVGKAAVCLVGQIVNRKEPTRLLANLPVFLLSGRKTVAQTLSNSFGEFQIEYMPRQHLCLFVQSNSRANRHIEATLSRSCGNKEVLKLNRDRWRSPKKRI